MSKAIAFTFSVVLLTMAGQLDAQVNPADAAAEEALRRQAATLTLKETLAKAKEEDKAGHMNQAAALYEECIKISRKLGGTGVETETAEAVNGLTTVRLKLGRASFDRWDFPAADKQMEELLKFVPDSAQGKEFKRYNAEVQAQTKGRMPSQETIAEIPKVQNLKVQVSELVQDGKLLFELRKLDDSEKKLKEAIKLDPDNKAAFYYLRLIGEERYAEEARRRDLTQHNRLVAVEKAWNFEIKASELPTPNPYLRTNVVQTTSKSRQAIMAKLDKFVIKELFFDGLPLSEVVKFLSDEAKKLDPEKKGINFIINPHLDDEPSARGAPLGFGPGGISDDGSGVPAVDPLGAPLLPAAPRGPLERIDLDQVIIKINPPLTDLRMIDALDAITKVAEPLQGRGIKFMVEDYAVVFSQRNVDPPQLFTRNFKVDLTTFIQGLEGVSGLPVSDISSGGGGGQGGGGGGRGGGGQGGQQGQGGLVSVPRVDVTGQGFGGGGQGGQGGQGGGGGRGGGGGGGQGGGQGGQGGGQGGFGISGVTFTNNMAAINDLARQFFAAAGVSIGTNATGGAATQVFFNDRTGILMVRASMQDLEIIQAAIELLNVLPPQVTVESKFAEVTQQDTRGVGFDWFLGDTALTSGILGSAGTQPTYVGQPNPGGPNPSGIFPSAGNPIPPSATDGFLTGGLRQQIGIGSQQGTIPTVGTITGILTDPQFRIIIRALEQRDGVDVLSAPRVTTISGRQAQVAVTDIATVVSSVDIQQQAGGAGAGTIGGTTTGAIGSTVTFTTIPLPLGPVLDVLPIVAPDGFSITMTLIPTFTEFIGYDNPGNFIPQAQSVGGSTVGVPLTAVLPLPRIRVRQVVTSVIVWDGQTVMLGGLISEDVRNVKDKVPVLGDIPWLGRLFRSESKSTSKKNLIIFVTPTIVDPAGNRMNREEELPFTANAVPPQPAWINRDKNWR
ncbi:MAG: hypothetical protein AB1705_15230 [Verrucomicrobiota bacterium]